MSIVESKTEVITPATTVGTQDVDEQGFVTVSSKLKALFTVARGLLNVASKTIVY